MAIKRGKGREPWWEWLVTLTLTRLVKHVSVWCELAALVLSAGFASSVGDGSCVFGAVPLRPLPAGLSGLSERPIPGHGPVRDDSRRGERLLRRDCWSDRCTEGENDCLIYQSDIYSGQSVQRDYRLVSTLWWGVSQPQNSLLCVPLLLFQSTEGLNVGLTLLLTINSTNFSLVAFGRI